MSVNISIRLCLVLSLFLILLIISYFPHDRLWGFFLFSRLICFSSTNSIDFNYHTKKTRLIKISFIFSEYFNYKKKNVCTCDKLVVCIPWYASIVDNGYRNAFLTMTHQVQDKIQNIFYRSTFNTNIYIDGVLFSITQGSLWSEKLNSLEIGSSGKNSHVHVFLVFLLSFSTYRLYLHKPLQIFAICVNKLYKSVFDLFK